MGEEIELGNPSSRGPVVEEDTDARALAAELFSPLGAYHRWLFRHRRLPAGLFAWQHPYESGIDNSPRFSNCDESRFENTARFAAPDFSTYWSPRSLHTIHEGVRFLERLQLLGAEH